MNTEPVAWMETYKGEPNNLDWDKSNLNYGDEFTMLCHSTPIQQKNYTYHFKKVKKQVNY